MGSFTLKKEEIIKSKKTIDYLFSGGAKSFCVYPIRVVYKEQLYPTITNNTLLVSVSKRKFKHAVDRNKIKRLLREGYRLNKQLLLNDDSQLEQPLALAFIYLSNKIFSFKEIEEAIKKLLTLIVEESNSENA